VLAPWLTRTLRALRTARPATLAALLVGGLPHFLLFALGAHLTSAGLTGLLVPGTVPLFVTLLLFTWKRERVPRRRVLALAAIVTGVAATAAQVTTAATGAGIAVLLAAGLVWAVYTLGLRQTTLDPFAIVVTICLTSALAAIGLAASGALPSHLADGTARLPDVLLFTALQGVGTGLLSTLAYAFAVRALGSSVAAATGAISPVLTAALAVPLFAEPVGAGLVIALALIVTGVLVFNLTPAAAAPRRPDGRCREGGRPRSGRPLRPLAESPAPRA
jgi:drug/metabolite transporter (DMT)-like permease